MNDATIKIGFCVAYDWEFLKNALPLVYAEADVICLSLDKKRISWSGSAYEFNDSKFEEFVAAIDKDSKIRIYEDDFYLAHLTPMENEVRQRNKMAEFLGTGGWHIQLDADEYFIDFPGFVKSLKGYKGKSDVNICVPFVILFKQVERGWLLVSTSKKEVLEYVPVATQMPKYEFGRRNGYFNFKINCPVIHQSWARSEREIRSKIKNWGHKNDFDTLEFLKFWEHLNETNFQEVKNFHPIQPPLWPSFDFIEGTTIEHLLDEIPLKNLGLYTQAELNKQNSLFRSRIKAFFKKLAKDKRQKLTN